MKRAVLFLVAVFISTAAFAAKSQLRETPVVLAVRDGAPAVVNISTEIVTRTESPFGGDPFFDKFFRDFFGENPSRERKSASLGSGVVVDASGHILTNEHVVRNASKITVTFADGKTEEASLVGADARTDLAVLKVKAGRKVPYIKLGKSSDLMIGETVIAIGNPFGLSHTVTTGVVSAVNRSIRGGDGRNYSEFIQTDASINPGNSGGPLLNIEGELIGINAAIYQSAEGIGFAIPIDKAKRIMNDLVNFGEVHRAFLGLQVQEVDEGLAEHYELSKPEGVLVRKVFSGSPAGAAGIKRGDLITAVDGASVRSRSDFFGRIAGFTAGSRLTLTLKSARGERDVTLTATETPKGYGRELARDWLGVGVEANTEKLARKYGAASSKGVMVTEVVRGGAADKTGLQPGDVIRQVNDADVADEGEFYKLMEAAGQRETVVLVVQRGRVAYHVSISP